MDTNPNRPKFKKVKRPIKKSATSQERVAVPAKSTPESPFNRSSNSDFNFDSYFDKDDGTSEQPQKVQSKAQSWDFLKDPEDNNEQDMSLRSRFIVGNLFTGTAIVATAAVCLILGIFFAKIFLSSPTTVQNGLQGVVINPEIPKGRGRCGNAEKTQGCVLYIMNPQRQDLTGRDFYDLAAQLTGRQRFMIETGNMRYANQKIRPGEIAQLNIPPLQ